MKIGAPHAVRRRVTSGKTIKKRKLLAKNLALPGKSHNDGKGERR